MRNQSKRDKGSSLIEIIVVLSVSSSIVVLAIGWIHQSMRFATVIRNHDRHHQSLTRLSRDFRDDAHFAMSATIQDQHVEFRIDDDEAIVYAIDGSIVERRRIRNPDEPDAKDEFIARESYLMADASTIRFDSSELPKWISITVQRADPAKRNQSALPDEAKESTRPVDLHVRAVVGRLLLDQRTADVDESANPSNDVTESTETSDSPADGSQEEQP